MSDCRLIIHLWISSGIGPINAWDRNAFISDVKYGKPSYEAQMNHVDHNMIIANYGASQGFDTVRPL